MRPGSPMWQYLMSQAPTLQERIDSGEFAGKLVRIPMHTSRTEKENYGPLPSDSASRKAVPIMTGVLDYFPAAIAEVAKVSKAGNDKHNPGEPMHHARGKSTDHADSAVRHLMERGGIDPDTGMRHSAEAAWRALANLQQELEDEGLAPLARGARLPEEGNSRDRREALAAEMASAQLTPDRPRGIGENA